MILKRGWRGFLISFLFTSSIFAQDLIELNQINVSATRLEMPAKETGKSVTILSSKEIQELPVQSIDELLRFIPGVNLNARQGFGVQSDIGMRGSTFAQVVVLVDNVRLNDPLTAHFNNNIPISIAEIDHIEIIRGPASASFGADAVGGVIHIKTKTYQSEEVGNSLHTSGNLTMGENNLILSDVGFSGTNGKHRYSMSLRSVNAAGEEFENPNFALGNSPDSLYNNFFHLSTFSGAYAYRINNYWNAYARLSYDKRDFAAKYFYTRSIFDESTEVVDSWWSQVALKRKGPKHETEINLGYKNTDDVFTFNPLFTANEHTTQLLSLNVNDQFYLNSQAKLAVGTQIQHRRIVSTDRGDHQNSSVGLYGILNYPLSPKLASTTSLRLEYDDNFGLEVLPQVSLAYTEDRSVVRASIGRSIRAGDFTERYISHLIPNLSPGRNIGNPDLEAETAYTADLGIDYYASASTFLSATIFYRFANNLIDYGITNANDIDNASNLQAGEEYFYAQNVSESNTLGLELYARKSFELGNFDRLSAQLGYNWLKTSNEDSLVSKYLSNHPKHNVSLNLLYDAKRFQLSTVSNFIQRNPELVESIGAAVEENYSITNLKLAYKIRQDQFKVFGQVVNLFDTQYQEILGARLPSRWFMLGIEWNSQLR